MRVMNTLTEQKIARVSEFSGPGLLNSDHKYKFSKVLERIENLYF